MAVDPKVIEILARASQNASSRAASKDKKFDSWNPIGLAFDVLDTPRSLITSGLKESVDLLNGDGFSFSDFGQQYREGYGFGDLIHDTGVSTGNKWLDRGVGLAGDILLDPLTYVGTPGAASLARGGGKGLAKAGAVDLLEKSAELAVRRGDDFGRAALTRLKAARNAVKNAGDDAARALAHTNLLKTEELLHTELRTRGYIPEIEQGLVDLGRSGGGAAAVKKTDVAEVLIGDGTSGVRLRPFWKNEGGRQLVSQETWSRITEPLRSMRGAASSSKVGVKVGSYFGSPETQMVKNAIREYRATSPEAAVRHIQLGADIPIAEALTHSEAAAFKKTIVLLDNKIGDNETLRNALRTAVETPDDALGNIAPELQVLKNAGLEGDVNNVRKWFGQVRSWANKNGLDVADLGETYFPIRETVDVLRQTQGGAMGAKSAFQRLREVRSKFLGEEVPSVQRLLEAEPQRLLANGTVDMSGTNFNWAQWRKEIETIGRRQLGDQWLDVIEKDPITLMNRYLNEVTKRVQIERIKQAAEQRGLRFWVEDNLDSIDITKAAEKLGAKGEQVRRLAAGLANLRAREDEIVQRLRAGGLADPDMVDLVEEGRKVVNERIAALAELRQMIGHLRKADTHGAIALAERLEKTAVRVEQRGKALRQMVDAATNHIGRVAGDAAAAVNPGEVAETTGWMGDMATGASDRARRLGAEAVAVERDGRDQVVQNFSERIRQLDVQIADIESSKDADVGKLIERYQKLRGQAERLDENIPKLEARVKKGRSARRATLKEKRELEAKIAELEGQLSDAAQAAMPPEGAVNHLRSKLTDDLRSNSGVRGVIEAYGLEANTAGAGSAYRALDDMTGAQLAGVEAQIASLQERLAVAQPQDIKPLEKKLATALEKRAELEAQIGGRSSANATRGGRIDKDLKNVRQNAARQQARLRAEQARYGESIVNARQSADAVARAQKANTPKLETLQAARAKVAEGTLTAELLDEQIALRESVNMLTAERQAAVSSIAAEFQPRANAVFDVLVGAADAEADLVRLTEVRSKIGTAKGTMALAEMEHAQMKRALAKMTAQKEHTDYALKVLGMKARDFMSFATTKEVADMLETMTKFQDISSFGKFLDRISGWWKGYATLSPGFHVRNAYSALFMNWVAGVPPQTQSRFFEEYARFARGLEPKYGEIRTFIDDMVKRGVLGRGNQFDTEVAEVSRSRRSWNPFAGLGDETAQSKYVGLNREMGGHVEGAVRGALAYHIWSGAGAVSDDAKLIRVIEGVNKFHFNYSDISTFEQKIKRVVPFYVWMSRNMPLQFELLATKPQPILAAQRLLDAMEMDGPPNPFTPDYYGENEYMPLSPTMFLTPELPFLAAKRDINKLANPAAMLSNVNPFMKVPIELVTGRDLFRGYELNGTDRTLRAAESFFPIFARVRRIFPAEDKYQERWLSSVASFLGVPVKELTNHEMLQTYKFMPKEAKGPKTDPKVKAMRQKHQDELDVARIRRIINGAAA